MGYTIYQLVQDFFHPQDLVTKCDAEDLRYFFIFFLWDIEISIYFMGCSRIQEDILRAKKRWDMMGYDGID